MSDGTLSVRRRQQKAGGESVIDPLRFGAFDPLLGSTLSSIGQGIIRGKIQSKPLGELDELRVESRRMKRLKDYDRLIKTFKYSAALDAVLRKVRPYHLSFAPGAHVLGNCSKCLPQQRSPSFKS